MKIIGVTNKYIAIQKDDDTLVLIPVMGKQELKVDLESLVYLTVKEHTISAQYHGGCEITDF